MSEMTIERLGDEISELAAHINAAMCRWLELVAEFDARNGWAEWGCKSCSHWISWRCSMGPNAAREHVRVANRLASLPLVREAFARGELSYSKVRAITRIDGVEREAELLELARTATASQLERLVRAYRGVVRAEDAAVAYEDRSLTVTRDDDGTYLVRGRLPADVGAVLVKALEAARDELLVAEREGASAEARASGLVSNVSAEARGSGLVSSVSAEAPVAGAARVVEGQSGGSAEPLARAERVTLVQRNADALGLLAEAMLAHGAGDRSNGDRYVAMLHVDVDSLAADAGERCEVDAGGPLSTETARRLCCDASIVSVLERDGEVLSVGRKTRAIPPALRRALRNRDDGCRFPGCGQRRWVDAHHIEHWAHGGETKLSNLVQLCPHHHRLVHEGGYTVTTRHGCVEFRRPDGRRLTHVPRPRRGDHHTILATHERRGLCIDAQTPVPRWLGERMDLAAGVDALLAFTEPRPPDREPELVPSG